MRATGVLFFCGTKSSLPTKKGAATGVLEGPSSTKKVAATGVLADGACCGTRGGGEANEATFSDESGDVSDFCGRSEAKISRRRSEVNSLLGVPSKKLPASLSN